jgi:hypothetical protein
MSDEKRDYGIDPAFDKALEAIDLRVMRRVGHRCKVSYSAYPTDDRGLPMDNLDDVPITGRVRFRRERNEFFGGAQSRDYESDAVESRTWLDLCKLADASIRTTNDYHHLYLEGVRVTGDEDGV